jgi:transglycosylase-like protein with SLT domain
MSFFIKIACVSVVVLLALVFQWRGQASANDALTCAQPTGFIPRFCVTLPVSTSVRRETTVQPAVVLTPNTDVRVEAGVLTPDVISVGSTPMIATVDEIATIDTTSSGEPPRAAPRAGPPVPEEPVNMDASVLRAYARRAAIAQGINPDLFVRQIDQESSFDPNARSKAGAVGIAQIMPDMHPGVDATDPYASLDYAARLMRTHLNRFGSWRLALIAYNAGPGRITPGNPAYLPLSFILSNGFAGGETKRYVANILG